MVGGVNARVGTVMAEEVSRTNYGIVNGDVGGMDGVGNINVGGPHKLGLSENKGGILMPTNKSKGRVVFIPNILCTSSPLEIMLLDEREDEVERGDGMGGMDEDLLLGGVITILNPTEDRPVTPKLEVGVVEGSRVLTVVAINFEGS